MSKSYPFRPNWRTRIWHWRVGWESRILLAWRSLQGKPAIEVPPGSSIDGCVIHGGAYLHPGGTVTGCTFEGRG